VGCLGKTCDRLTSLVRKHAAGITSKNRRLSSRVAVLTSFLALAFPTDIPLPSYSHRCCDVQCRPVSLTPYTYKRREGAVNPSNSICLIVFVLKGLWAEDRQHTKCVAQKYRLPTSIPPTYKLVWYNCRCYSVLVEVYSMAYGITLNSRDLSGRGWLQLTRWWKQRYQIGMLWNEVWERRVAQ